MVRTLLLFLVLFSATLVNAQIGKPLFNQEMLLFPQFETGSVKLKNGGSETTLMNYNTDGQNIVFVQNGQYMILTALETIDTVFIQGRKFIPMGSQVCELIANDGQWDLLATYTVKRQPLTATTDKAGTSKVSTNQVSNTVTNVYVGRNHKGNYELAQLPQFWLRYKGKVYKVTSKKQLLKELNPAQSTDVANFLDTHHVAFDNATDMLDLLHVVAKVK